MLFFYVGILASFLWLCLILQVKCKLNSASESILDLSDSLSRIYVHLWLFFQNNCNHVASLPHVHWLLILYVISNFFLACSSYISLFSATKPTFQSIHPKDDWANPFCWWKKQVSWHSVVLPNYCLKGTLSNFF